MSKERCFLHRSFVFLFRMMEMISQLNGKTAAVLTVCIYLAVINLIAFLLYGADKAKAKRGAWRIPEIVLIGISFLGGAAGAWLGMLAFRHKTRHLRFRILVPLALVLWIVFLVLGWKAFR